MNQKKPLKILHRLTIVFLPLLIVSNNTSLYKSLLILLKNMFGKYQKTTEVRKWVVKFRSWAIVPFICKYKPASMLR